MRKIPIPIAESLNFTSRLNAQEVKHYVSLQASPGVIQNARGETPLYNLNSPAKRITSWNGRTYVMTAAGGLWVGTDFIEGGFGDSSFFVAASTILASQSHLFVAGGTKMRKVANDNSSTQWGITPPALAPSPAPAGAGASVINSAYAYQYFNFITGQRSNRSPASAVTSSAGQDMLISGFVASLDPQVTHQIVLRDTGGDGIFREVGFKINTNATFLDVNEDIDLTDANIDTNDNATPPVASLAVLWRGSVWLNDSTNQRRVWVSVPGRMESFETNGIFEVGELNDIIRAFAVIGGNLFIWAQRKIFLVSGQYPFFTFDAISDLGIISMYSLSNNIDRAIFVCNSGVYAFNGATFQPIPDIFTFFDPDNDDTRRFTGIDPSNCTAAADNRFIWIGWTQTNGARTNFQYSISTQTWTTRNPFSAVSYLHGEFNTTGGDYDGNIVTISSNVRGGFVFVSPELELDLSKILAVEFDYLGGPFDVTLFVDGVVQVDTTLPLSSIRTNVAIPFPANLYGRRVYVRALKETVGEVAIAGIGIFTDELPSSVLVFDTGEVFLSPNKRIPLELLIHTFSKALITINGQLFIDGILAHSFELENIIGFHGPVRLVVPDYDGRSARLILNGTGFFSLLHASLGINLLGDKIDRVPLGGEYPAATRRNQQVVE